MMPGVTEAASSDAECTRFGLGQVHSASIGELSELGATVPAVTAIDPSDPVVVLCAAGMQAEGTGDVDRAQALFEQAWDTATTDHQGCIAAHYLARHQRDPADTLKWNERCLTLANTVRRSGRQVG